MSKIRELLEDKNSVLVFDVDGVLALMEWGEYNHYAMNDDDWTQACADGANYYTEDKVCKKMQRFLEGKDKNRIYVITTIGHNNEGVFKREYVNKYYGIPKDNVYYVKKNIEKTSQLRAIKDKYEELEDRYIVMVDDTVDILNDVMANTGFSTVHISSFLDM